MITAPAIRTAVTYIRWLLQSGAFFGLIAVTYGVTFNIFTVDTIEITIVGISIANIFDTTLTRISAVIPEREITWYESPVRFDLAGDRCRVTAKVASDFFKSVIGIKAYFDDDAISQIHLRLI